MKETEHKATLDLGKVAFYGTRKIHRVTLELEIRSGGTTAPHLSVDLEPTPTARELSICGSVWNHIQTDIISGGQNIEEVAKLFPKSKRIQRIAEIWRRWHLSGTKSGTRRQDDYLKEHYKPARYDYTEACAVLREGDLYKDRDYKYGSAWLCEPLPDNIHKEILELFK